MAQRRAWQWLVSALLCWEAIGGLPRPAEATFSVNAPVGISVVVDADTPLSAPSLAWDNAQQRWLVVWAMATAPPTGDGACVWGRFLSRHGVASSLE